jgi:hypothetical protein
MEKNKMMAIFSVIAVGLFGVYTIVNRNIGDLKQASKGGGIQSLEGAATINTSDEEFDLYKMANGVVISADMPGDATNMTKRAASMAFDQMKKLDQQGKNPFDPANASDPAVQKSIEASMSGAALLDEVIVTTRDIKVSTDNSRAAKMRYVKKAQEITARHPVTQEHKDAIIGMQDNVKKACSDGDSGVNRDIAKYYEDMANDYAGITVPSQWAGIHMEGIRHFKQGKIIFDAISNCVTDPLKGYSAIQILPQFGLDAQSIKDSFEKVYTGIVK